METTNENIRQLLEMLDHPDAYTEQEIRDIILRDEDTRETYRLMVEVKRSSRRSPLPTSPRRGRSYGVPGTLRLLPLRGEVGRGLRGLRRLAAAFIGLLLMSGIAFAAINIAQRLSSGQTRPSADPVSLRVSPMQTTKQPDAPADSLALPQPVTFDNIPLEKMLPQIAAYYDKEVEFQNADARLLRFYFVWKPEEGLEAALHRLNLFESVNIELKDNKIIVE